MRGVLTDWEVYCRRDSLDAYLKKTPQSEWTKRDAKGMTLIHYACLGRNDICPLLEHININAKSHTKVTALHIAVLANNTYMIHQLCKNGAKVSVSKSPPIEYAISLGYMQCARLLIAYGGRDTNSWLVGLVGFKMQGRPYMRQLNSQIDMRVIECTPRDPPDTSELEIYKSSVLRIRKQAIILMAIRKFRKTLLHLDRFLVRELAKIIWELRF